MSTIAPLLHWEGIENDACARVRITILGPAWCASNTRRVRLNISRDHARSLVASSARPWPSRASSGVANFEPIMAIPWKRNRRRMERSRTEGEAWGGEDSARFSRMKEESRVSIKRLRSTNVKYGNAIRLANETSIDLEFIPWYRSSGLPDRPGLWLNRFPMQKRQAGFLTRNRHYTFMYMNAPRSSSFVRNFSRHHL